MTLKQEDKKEEKVKEEPKQSCEGERKEICKEGADWVACGLSCEVINKHESQERRCKIHVKDTETEKSSAL